MTHRTALCSVLLVASFLSGRVVAQKDADVKVKIEKVSGHVYALFGRGGNIGVSVGDSGVFMIDDQYAPLTDKIVAAIKTLSDQPARFLLNTHWHGDHTGGNENFGRRGAVIVAHENVRARMSTDQFIKAFNNKVPASPAAALPVVTFDSAVTFHWNGDEIRVWHVPHAHTDGDAIVHFVGANAVHMGDVFFNEMYPFIDESSGGSVGGVITAVDQVLAMCDDKTRIIPGHGPLTDRAGMRAYRDMLSGVRETIVPMIQSGRSEEEIVAAKPTAAFDAVWGGGFLKPDPWTALIASVLRAELSGRSGKQ